MFLNIYVHDVFNNLQNLAVHHDFFYKKIGLYAKPRNIFLETKYLLNLRDRSIASSINYRWLC